MDFIKTPNLPEKVTSLAIVDGRISRGAEERLKKLGVSILGLQPHKGLYAAVSGHPDMQLHHLGGSTVVVAPGTDQALLDTLSSHGFELIMGDSFLTPTYPADIAYNVARVGKWYFHNLRYTDPILKRSLERLDIEPIHVEQGYSKCSILPVDRESIITMDAGIARAAEKKGLEVLLMESERSIRLPGLNHGFIGGAAGMLGKSLCALNGSMRKLDCFDVFSSFLYEKNIQVTELAEGHVADIGSILPLLVL